MEIVSPNRTSTRNVDKVMPQCKKFEVWFNVHSTYESGIYDIIKLQEIGIPFFSQENSRGEPENIFVHI